MVTSPAAATGSRKFEWTEAMSVGIPEIDADHKVLVELIGQIEDAAQAHEAENVVGTVLAALLDYTEYHFAREEKMQAACDYPACDQHKAKHDKLKGQVVDYMKQFGDDPNSVDIADLSAFLQGWLVEHIMHEDFGYKPFCKDNPKAGEAVRSVGLEFFMEEFDE